MAVLSSRLILDELIDAADAHVIVDRDDAGRLRGARFDLAQLPRIDALLAGRPVAEIPALVERLCSICPAAHHLAGMRALESLAGLGATTARAEAVRALLHHGAAVQAHAARSLLTAPAEAAALGQFARAVLAAVGAGRHFPETAVAGGVRTAVTGADRDGLAAMAPRALAAAVGLARGALACTPSPGGRPTGRFSGADVALVRADGRPDLWGRHLRAVAADGTVLHAATAPEHWDATVREAVPGSADPRPQLLASGGGTYRVGPVAQLRVGTLTTPEAAQLQEMWLADGQGAAAARAVVALHSVEVIAELLDDAALLDGPLTAPMPAPVRPGVGVGWVDGPRGLLVHRYEADAAGTLVSATLLTPTAQNAAWLSEMLADALTAADTDRRDLALEDAIREADPCLPCSSSAVGAMGVRVDDQPAGGL